MGTDVLRALLLACVCLHLACVMGPSCHMASQRKKYTHVSIL